MPELRWILVAFGLALLIGIYAWGRRASRRARASDDHALRPDPAFETAGEEDDSHLEDPQLAAELGDYSSPGAALAPSYAGADRDVAADAEEPAYERVEPRRTRIEPTFSEPSFDEPAYEAADDAAVEDAPAESFESAMTAESARATAAPVEAPTISMSHTPPPRRIERRKIIALRIAAGPERIDGAQLKAAFEAESLQHGKYDVFHRLEEDATPVFSVASMVEPGTFDPDTMEQHSYPGITLFAQLPGPLAGMIAFNELVACARRLHATLGGTLQDERGVPLTVHRIERIRQEIRDFEHRSLGEAGQRG